MPRTIGVRAKVAGGGVVESARHATWDLAKAETNAAARHKQVGGDRRHELIPRVYDNTTSECGHVTHLPSPASPLLRKNMLSRGMGRDSDALRHQ